MNICLFVIPCESVYNDILGWLFLAAFSVVASVVHLKLKYHDDFDKPVVIKDDIWIAHRILYMILKKSIVVVVVPEKCVGEDS